MFEVMRISPLSCHASIEQQSRMRVSIFPYEDNLDPVSSPYCSTNGSTHETFTQVFDFPAAPSRLSSHEGNYLKLYSV